MKMNILRGHESPETAYVVNDYPYGFRLRCKIRYWVETTPRRGQRFCSQTTNPKREGEFWNKPKKSIYSDITVLRLDENNHVVNYGFGIIYTGEKEMLAFFETMPEVLTPYESNQLKRFRAIIETRKHISVSVGSVRRTPEEQKAHDAEQAEVHKKLGLLYAYNLKKEGATL